MLRLSNTFRGVASCLLGDGSTIFFWEDLWKNQILANSLPALYDHAMNKKQSVSSIVNSDELGSIFRLPLGQMAEAELQQIQGVINSVPYDDRGKDSWYLIWGSQKYTASRFYRFSFENIQVGTCFKWLLKARCTQRQKFFC